MNRLLSIRLVDNLSDSTAEALGCQVRRDHTVWLVTEYVDQAQLTGIIANLAALNVSFDKVELATDPAQADPASSG